MKTRELAKLLLKESYAGDGNLDSARVAAVCEYVDTRVADSQKLPVLRMYLRLVRPELSREEARVQLSGDISDASLEDIKSFILRETKREKIRVKKEISKELLGGLRITCGDTIWERSVKSALDAMRSASK